MSMLWARAIGVRLPKNSPAWPSRPFSCRYSVMSRASLGHTGQVLKADGWINVIYLSLFASVLLRVAAGWRGKRAAIGTMLGFGCELIVLVGYVLRSQGGVS